MEEDHVKSPSDWDFYIEFLNKPHSQALQEYHDAFPEHVGADALALPEVLDMLATLGAEVFVKTQWDGIKHVQAFEIDWAPICQLR